MPLYQYKCRACQAEHEALQRIADKPFSVCPYCKARALEKQVTATSFRIGGVGAYKAGYSGKSVG
jgi:putative FmdB family regulatory protein